MTSLFAFTIGPATFSVAGYVRFKGASNLFSMSEIGRFPPVWTRPHCRRWQDARSATAFGSQISQPIMLNATALLTCIRWIFEAEAIHHAQRHRSTCRAGVSFVDRELSATIWLTLTGANSVYRLALSTWVGVACCWTAPNLSRLIKRCADWSGAGRTALRSDNGGERVDLFYRT